MTKVKIEDLKVFRAVAGVIGEARAKCELFKLQCERAGLRVFHGKKQITGAMSDKDGVKLV